MKSFYINPLTNDLELDGSNNLKMIDGDAELIQSVRIRIQTNMREWFLNREFGLDRSLIQGKKFDRDQVIDALYAVILQDERIATIDELEIEFDRTSRKLQVDFIFTKVTGETVEGGIAV